MIFREHELVASITRASFWDFVQEFWDEVVPEALLPNWHMELICAEMQEMAERVFRGETKHHDLIVNVSPGTSKSTIVSVMFPAWTWTRMPSCRCLCASYSHHLAMDLSRRTRDVVLSEKYRKSFPEVVLRLDQNTKSYFANTAGGIRYAVGTGGSVTGMHGHFLIGDDLIDPRESSSEAELRSANNWLAETFASRKVDKRVTPMTLVMQRLAQNDSTGFWLERAAKTTRHFCLPADCREYDVKPRRLRKFYKDGLMDPVRLPRSVLDEIRSQWGEFVYAGQYGQSPVPRSGGMFKTQRIEIDSPPPLDEFKKLCRFWDKAGTRDGQGAYTVGAKLGLHKSGRWWVLDVIRGRWDSDERERVILQTAKLDGREVTIGVEQEPGSGGKESAQATVRRLAGFRVRVDRPTGEKADRADPYSAQVNAGNVSLAKAEWNAAYLEELRYFPASTYKDQTDASAGAFNLLAAAKRRIGAL